MVQGNEAEDTKRLSVLSNSEDGESPENPTTLTISTPPTPASSTNRLKERTAPLELDFAEFKEPRQHCAAASWGAPAAQER